MIFEINFFLFSFALSNIYSYMCVYAKHYANVTNFEYGTLAMILPALSLVAKPVACSLTDAHGIHRQFLIGALSVFTISFGSLGVLPFFKLPEDHDHDSITWALLCVILSIGYVSIGCIFCMQDALASNYARKHNKAYGRMRIWACIGWASGACLVMAVGEVSWLPFRVLGCLILVVFTSIDIVILTVWPYSEDFEMFHDGSTVDQRKLSMVGPKTIALLAHKTPRKSISQDMLDKIKAGRSKSVGGVPRINPIEDGVNSNPKEEEPKEYSNFQCQMILMKMIAKKHKSFVRYIVLFTLFGIIQSMIWNYQLDYFKERVVKSEAEFEFISTLCMVAQSLFGEILINMVASEMIKYFGCNANMSLALVTIGLRAFFYSNILPYTSTYSVVVAEALQGPSLGMYWVLIVDVGSNFALMVTDFMPEMKRRGIVRDRVHEEELNGCLRATMIGVMSSSMEGLGVALGSLIGGVVSSSLGYNVMWNLCAGIGFTAGFLNLGWDLIQKLVLKKKSDRHSQVKNNNHIPFVIVEDPSTMKLTKGTRL